jgi:hypothetical protein
MKIDYKDYVSRARFLIETIECYQAEIAYIATQVCKITHGGRHSSESYTISKFAKDIGVNRKTLSGWISIYRNVLLKVGINHQKLTKKDWTTASVVDDLIRQEIRALNAINGTPRKKNIIKNFDDKKIKDLFGKYYNENDFQHDVLNYVRYVIFMKNNLISKDLNCVSNSSLIQLKENVDEISDTIMKHLSAKIKEEVKNETRIKTITKAP